MKRKKFTERELALLEANPFTAGVSATTIRFTLAFKNFVMGQVNNQIPVLDIMRKAGYDIEILGESRCYNIIARIKVEAESKEGLQEPKITASKFEQDREKDKNTDKAIKELQEEVIRLNQMLDVLKKTVSVDRMTETEYQAYLAQVLQDDML